mmetsp:Transcript_13919/g.30220  ORF Transcript_13919/g.30220 Transcript_13919/m.30220 type:complete len:109 (+) Transcript_13919:514-840(+)
MNGKGRSPSCNSLSHTYIKYWMGGVKIRSKFLLIKDNGAAHKFTQADAIPTYVRGISATFCHITLDYFNRSLIQMRHNWSNLAGSSSIELYFKACSKSSANRQPQRHQ